MVFDSIMGLSLAISGTITLIHYLHQTYAPEEELMENKGQDIAQNLQDINRLVHEPSRLMILAILNAVESADFLYLLRETQLTKGNLSSTWPNWKKAGWLKLKKPFRARFP